jgi:predicted nucleotidyltransferase
MPAPSVHLADLPGPDLETVTSRIVERFQPRRVVLFGSRVRGEAGSGSDLDLFVEMESDRRAPERAAEVTAHFGLRPWPLDVVVYTPEEVERLRGVGGTLLSVIEAEGRTLYPSETS